MKLTAKHMDVINIKNRKRKCIKNFYSKITSDEVIWGAWWRREGNVRRNMAERDRAGQAVSLLTICDLR